MSSKPFLNYSRKIELQGESPSLIDHSLISYKSKLYVFGGCDGKREFGDLYKIKLSNSTISTIESRGDVPTARYGHTAVLYKDFMYVFGGWDGTSTLNDFYQYSFSKNSIFWKSLTRIVSRFWYSEKPDTTITPLSAIPCPRYRHSSTVINKSLFIFGGISRSQVKYNDLFEYRITYSSWRKIRTPESSTPSPRTFHQIRAKKYSEEGALFMFGGSSNEKKNDFYKIFNSDFWQNCQRAPEKIGYGKNQVAHSEYNRSDTMAVSSDLDMSLSYLEERSLSVSQFGAKKKSPSATL